METGLIKNTSFGYVDRATLVLFYMKQRKRKNLKTSDGGYMKKIAVIQDLSGLGKCSLTAAIPVISAMGVQACPLPTAVLSNQTGYESYFCDDYTDRMQYFVEEWQKRGFCPDGIYTGFLASVKQIDIILEFIHIFKREHTKVIVDPVMGDNGAAYPNYCEEFCEKMKELVRAADVITPNFTEALLLLYGAKGMKEKFPVIKEKSQVEEQGCRLREDFSLETVVITGIYFPEDGEVANLVVTEEGCEWICSKKYGGSYSGTGDLFTSVLSAGIVKGEEIGDTVRRAVRFLEPAIRETVEEQTDRNDGVCFEKYLYKLWEV